jgi:hypothetical protein
LRFSLEKLDQVFKSFSLLELAVFNDVSVTVAAEVTGPGNKSGVVLEKCLVTWATAGGNKRLTWVTLRNSIFWVVDMKLMAGSLEITMNSK